MSLTRGKYHEVVVESPPEGWTRGDTKLRVADPAEIVKVEAWRRGAFAVHEVLLDEGPYGLITHAPTGYRIAVCSTMDIAAEVAEAIEPLADWAAITERSPEDRQLGRRVMDAVLAIDVEMRLGRIA